MQLVDNAESVRRANLQTLVHGKDLLTRGAGSNASDSPSILAVNDAGVGVKSS